MSRAWHVSAVRRRQKIWSISKPYTSRDACGFGRIAHTGNTYHRRGVSVWMPNRARLIDTGNRNAVLHPTLLLLRAVAHVLRETGGLCDASVLTNRQT